MCVCVKEVLVWWVGDGVGFEQCRARCLCVPPHGWGAVEGGMQERKIRVIMVY